MAPAEELAWRVSDTLGETGRGKNELRRPVDAALTADGGIAVLDADREAVVLFSRQGAWVHTVGGRRGIGDLRLNRPSGLAVGPDGKLWVADTKNNRLVVLDTAGKVYQTVGESGGSDGRFRHPTDVAFDRVGRVYVADSGNERIQVFRADGGFLASWERQTGGRRDHLGTPARLAYTDQGRGGLWVLSEGWGTVERFDLDGKWQASLAVEGLVPGPIQLRGMEIETAMYRMFLTDSVGSRVLAVDRHGALVGLANSPEGESVQFTGLAVDRSLELYVCDAAGARVVVYERRRGAE